MEKLAPSLGHGPGIPDMCVGGSSADREAGAGSGLKRRALQELLERVERAMPASAGGGSEAQGTPGRPRRPQQRETIGSGKKQQHLSAPSPSGVDASVPEAGPAGCSRHRKQRLDDLPDKENLSSTFGEGGMSSGFRAEPGHDAKHSKGKLSESTLQLPRVSSTTSLTELRPTPRPLGQSSLNIALPSSHPNGARGSSASMTQASQVIHRQRMPSPSGAPQSLTGSFSSCAPAPSAPSVAPITSATAAADALFASTGLHQQDLEDYLADMEDDDDDFGALASAHPHAPGGVPLTVANRLELRIEENEAPNRCSGTGPPRRADTCPPPLRAAEGTATGGEGGLAPGGPFTDGACAVLSKGGLAGGIDPLASSLPCGRDDVRFTVLEVLQQGGPELTLRLINETKVRGSEGQRVIIIA